MDSGKQNLLLKVTTYFAVLNGVIILILKLYGYVNTNSSAIFASLVDAALDITSSLMNMFALRFALVPPDANHRFGHDKIQDLAAFAQGIFFIISGLFVLVVSIYKSSYHQEMTSSEIGINTILISTILNLCLVAFQTYVLNKVKSPLIHVDRFHYLTDILTNIVVIISLYLSSSYAFLDSFMGIGIAIYIIHGAYSIIHEALHHLLDEEAPDTDKHQIIEVLKKYKSLNQIIAVHDLKTRIAGNKYFIQFHVELDGNLKLYETHAITENIEKDIIKIFPGSQIIIHQDPVGVDEDTPYRDELNTEPN
ncbi:MAG: cation diffusion facilitator family transporter [Rickettsiaceae bacterium]|nr:cation diffusion facilitator family transporter [Rickettsiaceae bacterium]